VTESMIHVPMSEALCRIIALSIERQDDEEFVDEVLASRGFEVISYKPMYKVADRLVHLGANGMLFPPSRDEEMFVNVYDLEGRKAAKRWLLRRLKAVTVAPFDPSPRSRRMIQRVMYVPVGSDLESRLAPKIRRPIPTKKVTFLESGTLS